MPYTNQLSIADLFTTFKAIVVFFLFLLQLVNSAAISQFVFFSNECDDKVASPLVGTKTVLEVSCGLHVDDDYYFISSTNVSSTFVKPVKFDYSV